MIHLVYYFLLMELTVDQALQQGVVAHRDGKQVLKQGKDLGLNGNQVGELEMQLNEIGTGSFFIENTKSTMQQQKHLISLYTQGKLQEALVQAHVLSKQSPIDPSIQNILGALYAGLGRYEEAITNYNKAIVLKPYFA
jgi:tetratricopeptide (TPR) repeat protein